MNSRPHLYQDSGSPEKPSNSHELTARQGGHVLDTFTHNCAETVRAEAKENPAALAGATGADVVHSWTEWLDSTLYRVDSASALTRALFALAPEHRLPAVETMLEQLEPGLPGVPFGRQLAEARGWAAWASWPQRKALALACYESLPARDQAAFLAHVSERRAAA